LREGVEGVRSALRHLGLSEASLVYELGELEPAADARARSLWE